MTTILVAPERWTQSPLQLERAVFLHRPTGTSSDQFASPLGFSSALNAQHSVPITGTRGQTRLFVLPCLTPQPCHRRG